MLGLRQDIHLGPAFAGAPVGLRPQLAQGLHLKAVRILPAVYQGDVAVNSGQHLAAVEAFPAHLPLLPLAENCPR